MLVEDSTPPWLAYVAVGLILIIAAATAVIAARRRRNTDS